MKPTLLGSIDEANLYSRQRSCQSNQPNRAGVIIVPNDGGKASFQNVMLCYANLMTHLHHNPLRLVLH
jgi:hypothetical protein